MAEDARAEIEAELRSVVQSTKGGVSIRNIQGDFRSLTGNLIPFSKYGYPSLEAMLREMPHVLRLERRGDGDIIVHAVATETTKHLSDLISKQKPNKSRAIFKPRRPVGQSNWRPPHTSHRRQNYLPSKPPSRYSPKPPYYKPTNPSVGTRSYYQPNLHSGNSTYHQPQVATQKPAHQSAAVPKPVPQPPKFVHPPKNVPPRFQKLSSTVPLYVDLGLATQQDGPSSPGQTGQSAQSPTSFSPDAPVFIPKRQDSLTTYSPPPEIFTASSAPASPPPQEPGLPWPTPRNNKELVDNYAFINGLKCVYRPMEQQSTKKKKTSKPKWLSQLILDDQKFLSYPVEMDTAEEANEEAAKRAVNKLNIDPNIISLPILPIKTTQEVEFFVEEMKKIVAEMPQGAVHYHIQDQFKKRLKMRLPSNWLDFVNTLDTFRIDRADDTHFILFLEKSPRATPEVHQMNLNGFSGLRSPRAASPAHEYYQSRLPEPLRLPDTKDWDVYITHAANTSNICFRLIDHADVFEALTKEMENHFNGQIFAPVKQPVCDAPYCAYVENTWHRVILQSVDEEGLLLCEFPDMGDSEALDPKTVFEIPRKFLELPFQAFRAELTGLSCFSNDQEISEMVIHRVIDKSLVALLTDRIEDSISLVLYDTSTEDDININKTILEEIFLTITPPPFHTANSLFDGYMGHVGPSGDVWLHVLGRSMELLNILIENVTEVFQLQREKNPVTSVHNSEMYCVLYNDKWHRAIPVTQSIITDEVSMVLIDIGIQTAIPLADICKFEEETMSLSAFPALAVRCRLNGISDDRNKVWNIKVMEKLLQLVPQDSPLLIKVANQKTENHLPVVDLFKRVQPTLELVSINQTLATHFQCTEPEVNGKLSRRSSLGATSPPPLSPLGFGNQPASPTAVLSPSSSYSFVDIDRRSGYNEDVSSLRIEDLCFESYSKSGNASPSVITPGSSAMVTSLFSPDFHGTLGDNNNAFNIAPSRKPFKSTTPPTSVISKDMLINKQEEIPGLKEYFDVYITSAASPKHFICQSVKKSSSMSALFKEMQNFYNAEENVFEISRCLAEVGDFLALKHKDSCWYRVRVQEIITEEPFAALIYLVDYGGFEIVKLSDLQVLYTQFCHLPYQAITASLAGIHPTNIDYSTNDCLQFKEMVEGKSFVSVVCAKESKDLSGLHGEHLSVELVDTSTELDVYIIEELVKKNIAKEA